MLRADRLLPLTVLLLAALVRPSGAAPRLLEDSTSVERWRLANGLEVVARNVPGAAGIAVTVGYRAGSGYDDAAAPGRAELLADLVYYGPAGDTPERTPEELGDVRPLGWGLRVNHRLVLLTEIVSSAQLPGVLQEAATRMRPDAPSDAALRASLRRVGATLARRWFSDPDQVPYFRVGELAHGTTDAHLVDAASTKSLARLKPGDVAALRRRFYNPSNAVLSLAGDLSGWDLHALVDAAFGGLAAGAAQTEPAAPVVKADGRVSHVSGITAPRAAVALLGPSVDDSLHASFYLAATLVGAAFGEPYTRNGSTRSHFSYALYDEPELLRLFPEVPADAADLRAVDAEMEARLVDVQNQMADGMLLDRVRASLQWLLGGPMPRPLVERLGRDASGLGTLATNQASRVLWKGDAFWLRYLGVFLTAPYDHTFWIDPLMRTDHQARLLLLPGTP